MAKVVPMNRSEAKIILDSLENQLRWQVLLNGKQRLTPDETATIGKIFTVWPEFRKEHQIVSMVFNGGTQCQKE